MKLLAVAGLASALAGQQVVATLEAPERVVVEWVVDTDGDGQAELVLATAGGRVVRHGLRGAAERSLAPLGALQLRDPAHSLLAIVDLAPSPGEEIVVADSRGTYWLPWPSGEVTPEPRVLARGARFTVRVDHPRLSPFVQDLDRDGRLDLMLPTLQGCVPYLQEPPADGASEPHFRALPPLLLPVRVGVGASNGDLDEEHQGSVSIPQVERTDLNGDGRPDLLTQAGTKRSFHLQLAAGGFAPPLVVDIAEFQDSTPSAVIAPGSTIVLGDAPMLQRGDIDGDGIPDFVIAHRRKVWTFLASTAGPQFTKARTQAVADDVTGMVLVDLDEDQRSDLLAFQVQVPTIASLLLGLVQSIDIDVKAVCYRAESGAFAGLPKKRRTVTLRVPPLLSLLAQQEEIVKRFLGILDKARPAVRGAFASAGPTDLALVSADGSKLELFPRAEVPSLDSAKGRRLLRELLFEDPNPVFDLERIFTLVSGLLDQRATTLTGEAKAVAAIPLRDAKVWALQRLLAANLDGGKGDEVVAIYTNVADPERRAFDVLGWTPPR